MTDYEEKAFNYCKIYTFNNCDKEECEKRDCEGKRYYIAGFNQGYEQNMKDLKGWRKQAIEFENKYNELNKFENSQIEKLLLENQKLKEKLSSVYNCMYCGCSSCDVDNCKNKRS